MVILEQLADVDGERRVGVPVEELAGDDEVGSLRRVERVPEHVLGAVTAQRRAGVGDADAEERREAAAAARVQRVVETWRRQRTKRFRLPQAIHCMSSNSRRENQKSQQEVCRLEF